MLEVKVTMNVGGNGATLQLGEHTASVFRDGSTWGLEDGDGNEISRGHQEIEIAIKRGTDWLLKFA